MTEEEQSDEYAPVYIVDVSVVCLSGGFNQLTMHLSGRPSLTWWKSFNSNKTDGEHTEMSQSMKPSSDFNTLVAEVPAPYSDEYDCISYVFEKTNRDMALRKESDDARRTELFKLLGSAVHPDFRVK